jgi:hypothetical protein
VGEAGLGAAEVGEKIAEHREHSLHAELKGHDRVLTIIEAALLAAVALMAAWSGFASAKWSTESRLKLAAANAARVESNRAAGEAAADKEFDSLAFNAWFGAAAIGNQQAMKIAERRFRPEFKVAFDAWIKTDPLNNDNAPPGPTYMPEYKLPQLEEADKLEAEADHLSEEGAKAGETADRYVRVTVFFASVLFLVGISGHFRVRAARYGLIGTAIVILTISIALLVTSPWPPA